MSHRLNIDSANLGQCAHQSPPNTLNPADFTHLAQGGTVFMWRRINIQGLVGLLAFALVVVSSSAKSLGAVDESQDSLTFDAVREIFRGKCLRCHGADEPKAGLDLRSHEATLAGGELGPVIEAGSLEESLLWDMVDQDEMPPVGEPLTVAEKALLRDWIEAGAPPGASQAGADQYFSTQEAASIDSPKLDALIAEQTSDSVTPNPISDEQFLRRVSLDLIGRPPTPEELAAFLLDESSDRRDKVVDQLLDSSEFGRNWANYWSDVISYRVPPPELTFLRYDEFEEWLAERFNEETPWDAIVREILTAQGKVQDNPATTFVAFHQANPAKLSAETARIFLGVQIQCAECHDHKFDHWKREQFHSLAAFYGRTLAKLSQNDPGPTEVKDREKGEYVMPNVEEPDKKGTTIAPTYIDGNGLELGTDDLQRREFLADSLTQPTSPYFARAYVNRVWARLAGRGFFEPVDNMAAYVRHDWPEVHEALAAHFAATGFDVKDLFRLVLKTDFYRRTLPLGAVAGTGAEPFGAARSVKLRGDEVFDSLVRATEIPNVRPPAMKATKEIRFPPPPKSTRELVAEEFGYDPSFCPEEIARSMGQAMLLMNNDQIQARIDAEADSKTPLAELLTDESDDREVVFRLFERTLARWPTDREIDIALDHLEEVGDRGEAFEDLLWSLINSAEFTTKR